MTRPHPDTSAAATAGSVDHALAARLFAEAQAHARAGDVGAARQRLVQAAQGGHLPAQWQLGLWDLIGLGAAVDVPAAVARLRDAAGRGHLPAVVLQAQLVAAGAAGMRRDFPQVLALLLEAARGGESSATLQLAMLLPDAPEHAEMRSALIRVAAAAGQPTARLLAERLPPAPPGPLPDWEAVRSRVAWPHERPLPPAQPRSEQPRVVALPGLLSPHECVYLALKALPLLRPARIVGRDGASVVDPIRTNEAAKFGLLEADAVVRSLDLRVAAALGLPAEHGEGLALLRYQVGQQYLPHCDWIDPQREANRDDLERRGQRVATCVVYLNDGFEGGSTGFPKLGLELRGGVGDAFAWDNLRPDGSVEPLTLHTGRPPTSGMKYLLSKWMRDRPQAEGET